MRSSNKGAATAAPILLPFTRPQPTPKTLHAVHVEQGGWPRTVIVRTWEPGDARSCTRCTPEACQVGGGGTVCVMSVLGHLKGLELVHAGAQARVSDGKAVGDR